jgi:ribosomal protein S18 acetylase RimI-like enzyme
VLLNEVERNRLADTIGDTVETVITYHLLRRGLCDAYLLGDTEGVYGAIVRDWNMADEPTAYGNSPELMWEILHALTAWFCVNIATDLAQPLGRLVEAGLGVKVRYYGDVYYALNTPVKSFANGHVRQLTLEDLPLLEAAREEMRATGFGGARPVLENGFVACAVVDNEVVAIAQSYARTEKYADVGVATLPEYRGRGFATAAASIVARRLREAGQTPVWSTGEDNSASRRVAEKLGFTEAGRRAYVIVEK